MHGLQSFDRQRCRRKVEAKAVLWLAKSYC